jgi:hypothetical protein
MNNDTLAAAIKSKLEAAHKISELLPQVHANIQLQFWSKLIEALQIPDLDLSVKKLHRDREVRHFHWRNKRAKEYAEIGIKIRHGRGQQLWLLLHDNLWYTWERNVDSLTARPEYWNSQPWKYPERDGIPELKLNFWEFDPSTREHLRNMDRLVDDFVAEILDMLAKLEFSQERGNE